jgi:hypothetical protein
LRRFNVPKIPGSRKETKVTATDASSSCAVHESRWGFHPVDWQTFQKLKALHKHYWATVRGLAAWFRWHAKQPQNRVRTERIKDESGRVTGWSVLGPWEEPRFCPMFGKPESKRGWLRIPEHLDDRGILEAYRLARFPRAREEVQPLTLTASAIDALYREMNL